LVNTVIDCPHYYRNATQALWWEGDTLPAHEPVDTAAQRQWAWRYTALRREFFASPQTTAEQRDMLRSYELWYGTEALLRDMQHSQNVDVQLYMDDVVELAMGTSSWSCQATMYADVVCNRPTVRAAISSGAFATFLNALSAGPTRAVRNFAAGQRVLLANATTPVELPFRSPSGEPFDLRHLRGRIVLVDFFTTTCGPCLAALPTLQALYAAYHAQGLEMVSVSLDGSAERDAVVAYMAKHPVPWTTVIASGGYKDSAIARYAIQSVPTFFVLDRSGHLIVSQTEFSVAQINVTLARALGVAPHPIPVPDSTRRVAEASVAPFARQLVSPAIYTRPYSADAMSLTDRLRDDSMRAVILQARNVPDRAKQRFRMHAITHDLEELQTDLAHKRLVAVARIQAATRLLIDYGRGPSIVPDSSPSSAVALATQFLATVPGYFIREPLSTSGTAAVRNLISALRSIPDTALQRLGRTHAALPQYATVPSPVDAQFITTHNDTIRLAALRGKYVVLYFWNPNDTTYRRELPMLATMAQKIAGRADKFVFFSVPLTQEPQETTVLDSAAVRGAPLMRIVSSGGRWNENMYVRQFGIDVAPFVVVLDETGRVQVAGSVDLVWLSAVLSG
jgi:thiol-disulfide isomerase/thioredoxin